MRWPGGNWKCPIGISSYDWNLEERMAHSSGCWSLQHKSGHGEGTPPSPNLWDYGEERKTEGQGLSAGNYALPGGRVKKESEV